MKTLASIDRIFPYGGYKVYFWNGSTLENLTFYGYSKKTVIDLLRHKYSIKCPTYACK